MPYALATPRQLIRRKPITPIRGRRGIRGMGSPLGWDCSQPILRSNYYGDACVLGEGSVTEACLAKQDQLEQQFVADQNSWKLQCTPGADMTSQQNWENYMNATYDTAVYGANAPAAIQQAAQFAAADAGPITYVPSGTPASPVPVVPKPPAPAPVVGQSNAPAPSVVGGGVAQSNGVPTGVINEAVQPSLSAFLSGSAFFGLPNWVWLLVGAGGLYAFSGGHR